MTTPSETGNDAQKVARDIPPDSSIIHTGGEVGFRHFGMIPEMPNGGLAAKAMLVHRKRKTPESGLTKSHSIG